MAITAVVGLMGSGKSYESVRSHILPALKAGRRVVSNISGLSYERIRDYLGPLKDGQLLAPDRLLVVSTDRVSEPDFFPWDKATGETVCRPGDLVVLDEAWNFWGDGAKLSDEHRTFLRMHRHMVDENGQTCDVTLVIQDLQSLDRFVKNVVAFTARCRKMVALGLGRRYAVDLYEGKSLRKPSHVGTYQYKYDPRVFPLYQSYDGDASKETNTDKRVVLWRSPGFISAAVLGVGLLVGCGFLFLRMVGGMFDGSFASRFLPKMPAAASTPVQSRPTTAAASSAAASPAPAVLTMVGFAVLTDGRTVMWVRNGDGVRQVEATGGMVDGPRTVLSHEGKFYALGN